MGADVHVLGGRPLIPPSRSERRACEQSPTPVMRSARPDDCESPRAVRAPAGGPWSPDHNREFGGRLQAAARWTTSIASATGVRKPTFKRFQPLIATIARVTATTCSEVKWRVSSSKSSSGAPESGSRVSASHHASAARSAGRSNQLRARPRRGPIARRSRHAHAPQSREAEDSRRSR